MIPEAEIARAHALADRLNDDVAIVAVPEGPLLAVFGGWMLRPLRECDTPGLMREFEGAAYVALPGEAP